MGFDRDKMQKDLMKRTEESMNRKEGDSSSKYFQPELDFILFRMTTTKDDPHLIDIIPFKVGKHFPTHDNRRIMQEGEFAYVLDLYVHSNIGPGKFMFVCMAKNYGERCAVCDYIAELVKKGKEWDDYSNIAAKRRCSYNIVCYDTKKETDKGIQVLEASHRYTEKAFLEQAKSVRGGGVTAFAHPDVGKSIKFFVANDEYKTVSGHGFVDRDYKISDELLDKAHSLDDLIYLPTYKEVYDALNDKGADKAEEDWDKVTKEALPKEEAKAQEAPQATKEPEPVKQEEPQQALICQLGGVFGIDVDQLDGCMTCKIYDPCLAAFEERDKKRRERRKA
jgi:hypothetical protein